MTWQVGALVLGPAGTIVPPQRLPASVIVLGVAAMALVVGVVPLAALGDAVAALASPLAFLLVAVPLAVALDDIGFFASASIAVRGGRHLRLHLWVVAAAVTAVFNLDAAVILLTPLYVHIARRHGDDSLALAFIPALTASLASTLLPVSNLTTSS